MSVIVPKITPEALKNMTPQQIADMMNTLAAAAASQDKPLRCKVSEKGAISVYGLNVQFPVTLYAKQWERLAGFMPEIIKFAKLHADKLSQGKPKKDDTSKAA